MELLEQVIHIGEKWDDIRSPDCPLVLQARTLPFAKDVLIPLLAREEFDLRAAGAPSSLAEQLDGMPQAIIRDAVSLARRFATFMKVKTVRLRIERIDRNACKKIHADYTDVRLLCTYAGPGTDYVVDPGDHGSLERMDEAWIGLFKGRNYASGHVPAFHRSPPVEDTGEKRLLLVIDTPLQPETALLRAVV